MPIASLPHRYTIALDDDIISAAPRAEIRTGTPTEFGGTDDVWSPEHLLVAAAAACLKSTFDAYAKRDRIEIHGWQCVATGVLVKGREGPVFDTIDLDVEIVASAGDEARVQSLLASAESRCIVSRALSAPVRVTGSVRSNRELAAS